MAEREGEGQRVDLVIVAGEAKRGAKRPRDSRSTPVGEPPGQPRPVSRRNLHPARRVVSIRWDQRRV